MAAPVTSRIQTLDSLRGFALLGILLLNILGFGLPASAYFAPEPDASTLDTGIWAVVEISAEGAMRALFSMLFGAGILLFTTGVQAKSAALHYRRNFWLLCFGLLDVFVLLWVGDILVVYALVGFLLYWVRNVSARRLLWATAILLVLMALQYQAMHFGLEQLRAAAQAEPQGEAAVAWQEFAAGLQPSAQANAEELAQRNAGYVSAWRWSAMAYAESLVFVVPVILFWDALVMMLLGMVLFKTGVLQGQRSRRFYVLCMLAGFASGLIINTLEARTSYLSGFDVLASFSYIQPTYQFGRLGMALGWMSLIVLLVNSGWLHSLMQRLAAVGRMALTNYLAHSLIALLLFTGAGLGLAGQLSRAQLYLVVLAIWVLQMWVSGWWLHRYRFGPMEWLWRGLTYGRLPANKVTNDA